MAIYLLYVHILFMAAAVGMVVRAAAIARGKKAGWFVRHRTMALLGVLSALIAFTAELTFKSVLHYPHLRSPHAIAGAITLVLLLVTSALGSLIASNPAAYRRFHRALGKITSAAVVITGLMGIARFLQLASKK